MFEWGTHAADLKRESMTRVDNQLSRCVNCTGFQPWSIKMQRQGLVQQFNGKHDRPWRHPIQLGALYNDGNTPKVKMFLQYGIPAHQVTRSGQYLLETERKWIVSNHVQKCTHLYWTFGMPCWVALSRQLPRANCKWWEAQVVCGWSIPFLWQAHVFTILPTYQNLP